MEEFLLNKLRFDILHIRDTSALNDDVYRRGLTNLQKDEPALDLNDNLPEPKPDTVEYIQDTEPINLDAYVNLPTSTTQQPQPTRRSQVDVGGSPSSSKANTCVKQKWKYTLNPILEVVSMGNKVLVQAIDRQTQVHSLAHEAAKEIDNCRLEYMRQIELRRFE